MKAKSTVTDWVIPMVAIFGLYWFSSSFFLAKRSLPFSASCDEAFSLLTETLQLTPSEATLLLPKPSISKSGCWLPRKIDSMVILVVDALRFDFAQHNLPESIGKRITTASRTQEGNSQLLQFVADPPTVTMQRLKGLTTGSLPTFADISGNFGGSTMEEDSWVQQLKDTPFASRGLSSKNKMGFVGDDTWVDLFPTQFEESHPYPSFNTRDLDTVDNGCLKELPNLLPRLRMKSSTKKDDLEVIVAHFLGVDHVGHTFGPHNQHMDQKLRQMDSALSKVLERLDSSADESCHLALIFGDHGMTEDGNHGGGTDEEVNAALFVHFSNACHMNQNDHSHNIMGSEYVQEVFESIHQIDLVPTVSILLGLPIPYQNIGGISPSLLPSKDIRETAAALALNAAQVWRYFTVYSETANRLPNLSYLQERLQEAVSIYQGALKYNDEASDSDAFYKACGLFKIFLVEASDLGHRVWTRFDTLGMAMGAAILLLTVILYIRSLILLDTKHSGIYLPKKNQLLETGLSTLFIFFQSGMLSFSNSYIEAEQKIVMFMMAILGGSIFVRMQEAVAGGNVHIIPYSPLMIPILSRVGEIMVSGHGLDPSIRLHPAHSPYLFIPSLVLLLIMRIRIFRTLEKSRSTSKFSGQLHLALDTACLLLLVISWLEKRSTDTRRNGYLSAKGVIGILTFSIPMSSYRLVGLLLHKKSNEQITLHSPISRLSNIFCIVTKLLIAMMLVTGPATSTTVLLVSIQAWMLYLLGGATGFYNVSTVVQSILWRFTVRHVFFSTNHGCAFNRLQYSAAFVATNEFGFALGGLQLFLNTFGWEIVGMLAVYVTSHAHKKYSIWRWYCFFQLLESFLNCISVSLLKRHLMVWAVYAPRFLFSSIFLVLNCLGQLILDFTLKW